jgi:crotonobetainyl-CoA:carnitine CoA-transferase CaiB-like acyl-CoA transferase
MAPEALARKYPNAAREWHWQYVFPARQRGIATPIRNSDEAQVEPRRAPRVGEHSRTILTQNGFTLEEIDKLAATGVITEG